MGRLHREVGLFYEAGRRTVRGLDSCTAGGPFAVDWRWERAPRTGAVEPATGAPDGAVLEVAWRPQRGSAGSRSRARRSPTWCCSGDGSSTLAAEAGPAEGLAVRGGRIVALGDGATLREYVGPTTEVVDLRGRTVLPGLHRLAQPHALGGPQRDPPRPGSGPLRGRRARDRRARGRGAPARRVDRRGPRLARSRPAGTAPSRHGTSWTG